MEGLFVMVLLGSLRIGLTNLAILNEGIHRIIEIGCIDCLAYRTIFMRAMFCPKKNLMFFFRQKRRR